MRLRHFELVRSLDPVTEEGVTRVPEKRMPEFRRLWSAILDEEKSVTLFPVKVEGFRGGTNRMPIVMLGYLSNLVDPASLERRFASLTESMTLTRRAAALLLGSLAGLEGKMVPVQDTNDAGNTREAMLPWSFAPVVRENLAYNFFTLYQIGAEINKHRSSLFQSANSSDPALNSQIEAYLDEEVSLRLIHVGAQDLNLKQNAIPLATLSGIKGDADLIAAETFPQREKSEKRAIMAFNQRFPKAFNSTIQSLKAGARGFRNFENYRTRILFFLGKRELLPL
jgi:hypothetical protein